jgi:hypothetical protein
MMLGIEQVYRRLRRQRSGVFIQPVMATVAKP